MSPNTCTADDIMGIVFATLVISFVAVLVLYAFVGPPRPVAQRERERMERREQRALNARTKELMAAGMLHSDASITAFRERERESQAVVRSLLAAEKAMRGEEGA